MNDQRPFTIRIFAAEGSPDGLRHVEKGNWTGLGVVCPRSRYAAVKGQEEFAQSGVYLLIGNRDEADHPTLYIGEAESIRQRLDSHLVEKDFWQQAIIFTRKGDSLNKAEIRYLEAKLLELAGRAKRCALDNSQKPGLPKLSRPDVADVEGYLEEMLSLMPVIGINVFDVPQRISSPKRSLQPQGEPSLYYYEGNGWEATGYEANSGFVVRKGSVARGEATPSMQEHLPSSYRKRQQLIDDGVLQLTDNGYVFTMDYSFSSPSQAADVCSGYSSNGLLDWKDSQGVSLKENQARDIPTPAGPQPSGTQEGTEELAGNPITYHFRSKQGEWDARGHDAGGKGFTVLKGSIARKEPVSSMEEHQLGAYNERQELINRNTLVEVAEGYRFEDDYTFSSPSKAADVCAGNGGGGPGDWKDTHGVSLKEHRQRGER